MDPARAGDPAVFSLEMVCGLPSSAFATVTLAPPPANTGLWVLADRAAPQHGRARVHTQTVVPVLADHAVHQLGRRTSSPHTAASAALEGAEKSLQLAIDTHAALMSFHVEIAAVLHDQAPAVLNVEPVAGGRAVDHRHLAASASTPSTRPWRAATAWHTCPRVQRPLAQPAWRPLRSPAPRRGRSPRRARTSRRGSRSARPRSKSTGRIV